MHWLAWLEYKLGLWHPKAVHIYNIMLNTQRLVWKYREIVRRVAENESSVTLSDHESVRQYLECIEAIRLQLAGIREEVADGAEFAGTLLQTREIKEIISILKNVERDCREGEEDCQRLLNVFGGYSYLDMAVKVEIVG